MHVNTSTSVISRLQQQQQQQQQQPISLLAYVFRTRSCRVNYF